METFIPNILERLKKNPYYRHVIYTDKFCQVVLMTIEPDFDIEKEEHPETTQFIKIESGKGKAVVNKKEFLLSKDSILIIPPGTTHQIWNTSETENLLLYTIYSGKILHKHGLIQKYIDEE